MGNNNGDDLRLWERSLERDDRAFGVLFDRHRDRVFRHVLRLVDSRADAEDVVASAFFELWRLRTRVRVVNGSVLPWLLVTATNLARNNTRRSRRYSTVIASLPRTNDSDDPSDLFDESAAKKASQETVRRLFTSLRDTDVALLCLVVLEDHTLVDAARALGISHGAARTRMHRLKTHARALMTADADLLQQPLTALGEEARP